MQAGDAVSSRIDTVPAGFQKIVEIGSDRWIIFDYEYMHGWVSC
jgi:hypothetical protein